MVESLPFAFVGAGKLVSGREVAAGRTGGTRKEFSGGPATVARSRSRFRPVALRPRLSAGLLLSAS